MRLSAAAAVLKPSSLDGLVGEGATPLGVVLATDTTDPLEGMEADALLARMREEERDALALIELAQHHRAPLLVQMLGSSRAKLPSRLAVALAWLQAVA